MHEDRKQRLTDFADWVKQHITGDEKGEAQIFLDRLFQAFGLKGVKEAGAVCEQRVKKADAASCWRGTRRTSSPAKRRGDTLDTTDKRIGGTAFIPAGCAERSCLATCR